LQPGPTDGKDAEIRDDYPTTPFGSVPDVTSNAWTVDGNPCILRSLICFDLSSIPTNAIIHTAVLSLYCNINSDLYQLQSGDNQSYLYRITEAWEANSVTWNTQPATTSQSSVLLPSSTSTTQDYPDIDVVLPVREMVLNPTANYGWMLQLVTEEIYRSMVFASSDNTVPALRPKLVVTYSICPNPIANFKYTTVGKTISFSDSSSFSTSWYWSFGDGYFSNLRNPVHEYAQLGKYQTCLTIQDSCGSNEFCDTVYACESPETSFSFIVTDHMVDFRDLSQQATSWSWSFSDGFYSDLQNPSHYFNDYGIYYVCLTSGNGCKQKTFCDSVAVKHPSGIADESSPDLILYPNPAHGFISINIPKEFSAHPFSFKILDQTGIIRKTGTDMLTSGRQEIDLSGLSTGLYSFRVISEKGVKVMKFIIY
jgi:PKD repeat protein